MPLSWNEIRARATTFAAEWQGTESEDADAKPFWDAFFDVFGVSRRKVSSFEKRVHKLGTAQGKIDLLWKGTLLIEHKSLGRDLDRAYQQAIDYFPGLKPEELPRYVLVCDFERFELHDLEPDDGVAPVHKFKLSELPQNIHHFAFIAGYRTQRIRESDPINQEAVVAVGQLHDALKRDNYTGQKLEVFLVRLLFCLFADDTGIFQPKDSFHDLIEFHTHTDGSDVGAVLDEMFSTLNEEPSQRQGRLAEHFALFPYVNGKLFEAHFRPPQFDTAMRQQLLTLCAMNWGAISPAIFGAMFQTVIELEAADRRRQLGAHYTSEANILKLLGPLCLDELQAEFEKIKTNQDKLFEFHKKLQTLTFLDPACGCGNFLVIAYRELRKLEFEVLRAAAKFGQRVGSVFGFLQVDVDQFYGIEIEEFPAQIAQVAMWLTDHQMNVMAGVAFGEVITRIPLVKSANIRKGNALEIDWAEFVPPRQLNFIMGNPPFIGKQMQSAEQKAALASVTHGMAGAGVLDFVAGWFVKAGQYISSTPDGFGGIAAKANKGRKNFKDVKFGQGLGDMFAAAAVAEVKQRRAVRCGFVSTNSITQGEQVGVLWAWMLAQGMSIRFAHRTFQWTNDAPGKAAVHCVIVGFGMEPAPAPRLFEYEDIQGVAHEVAAKNINPYLVDAPSVALPNRRAPICKVSPIVFGSMPNDGGGLLLKPDEKAALLAVEPAAASWLRRFMGADEFINNGTRWCLWLKDCPPQTLTTLKAVRQRLEGVRQHRANSARPTTQALAATPALFGEDRQPQSAYLFVPRVSSEKRQFVPIGFMQPKVVASDAALVVPNATAYEFGVLSSTMHNAWVRYTCGRLKSDFRYSAGIVYNNYPWPQDVSDKLHAAVSTAAQGVLEARALHQKGKTPASLADLYNPITMPANLTAAHKALDKAVDAAYGTKGLKTDAERVAFLFTLYQHYTSLLV
ncbi:DNA methyltransferase [Rhodoferax sp.]|uniref:class I SAM-dependent DNA methyltransferase n=1 Tax=Rhodoferax sp. TaxID=50421 RepID=UPI002621C40F|nr:DNA methyltransferase [Rhodoferax sp.]MDD2811267.1 N-6 DNA methylase [Rhodoferax sp.]